jgi:hypothetical protein
MYTKARDYKHALYDQVPAAGAIGLAGDGTVDMEYAEQFRVV